MTSSFYVRKIYSAVERIDGFESSLEIIIVLLKLTFFGNKHTIAERIAQTMHNYKISHQTKYIILERMITATLSMTKTDIQLQRKDGCS